MARGNNTAVITNAQESIPVSSAGTGTISSQNTLVVGVGTLFTTEVKKGDFLYLQGTSEFLKVIDVCSDTEIYVEEEPAAPLAAVAFRVTPRPRYQMVSWLIDDAGTASIDGIPFPAGSANTFEKSKDFISASSSRVDPFEVDSTANSNSVYITYQF